MPRQLPQLTKHKSEDRSLSELKCEVFVCIFAHNLCNGKLKVFLSHMDTTLPQCKHTRLLTDAFRFGA